VKDALTAVAAAKPGRTLIVSVQDSLWATWGQPLTKGPVSVGTLIDALRSWSQYESVSHGGAIVIRSVDPQSAEESRADRKVMGRFARALSSNGPSSLPDSAAFLYDASRRYSGLAGDWLMYGQIAVGADPPISAKSYGPQILRALGPITSSQWRRLLSGQVLTAGELGIAKCLNDLLSSWTAVDFYSQSTYPDWRKFFWELTPPGLPSDAPVALSQVSSRLVKYWDRQPEPNWGIPEKYLGEHFVWNKFHVQLENGTPSISGDRAEFEKSYSDRKFRYCELPVFQLTIGLPDGVELRETIQASMLNDDEVLQFADLKSELKDLIWKTVCDRSLAGISATRASTSPVIQPAAPPKVIPPR